MVNGSAGNSHTPIGPTCVTPHSFPICHRRRHLHQEGLLSGAGYAWITGDPREEAFFDNGNVVSEAVLGGEGSIGLIESQGDGTTIFEDYQSRWVTASSKGGCDGTALDKYCDADGSPSNAPSGYSMTLIESVLLLAKALDTDVRNVTFRSDPDEVYARMKAIGEAGYVGPTGDVLLDNSSDRLGTYAVVNLQVSVGDSGSGCASAGRRLKAEDAFSEAAAEGIPRRFAHGVAQSKRRLTVIDLQTTTAQYAHVGNWSVLSPDIYLIGEDAVCFPGDTTDPPLDEVVEVTRTEASTVVMIAAGGACGFIILVASFGICRYRRRTRRYLRKLHSQLEELKDSAVGMRIVTTRWDPRGEGRWGTAFKFIQQKEAAMMAVEERTAKPQQMTRQKRMTRQLTRKQSIGGGFMGLFPGQMTTQKSTAFGSTVDCIRGALTPKDMRYLQSLTKAKSEMRGLTKKMHSGSGSSGITRFFESLTKQSSRGSLAKRNRQIGGLAEQSSSRSSMNDGLTEQKIVEGGLARTVPHPNITTQPTEPQLPVEASPSSADADALSEARLALHEVSKKLQRVAFHEVGGDGLPANITAESRTVLLLFPKMLVQTSIQRPDGWAFGKVMFDEEPDRGLPGDDFTSGLYWRKLTRRCPLSDGEELHNEMLAQALQTSTEFSRADLDAFGVGTIKPCHFISVGKACYVPVPTRYSFEVGWFPIDHTDVPDAEQLMSFQNSLGGDGASDSLKEPATWAPMADPLSPKLVLLTPQHGEEMAAVQKAFMATHGARHDKSKRWQIVSVQRVQSLSMWQSYAVKRQTILMRENALGDLEQEGKLDKRWLFHGTDEDTVYKIIVMGFNRSFAGKNAVMYGKGVYFARDASYSDDYANADSEGIKRMFLCRVVVGEYCQGYNERLVPDVRVGQTLYDSTVNCMKEPIMYVTYHDAQAYPEYLIKYKHA